MRLKYLGLDTVFVDSVGALDHKNCRDFCARALGWGNTHEHVRLRWKVISKCPLLSGDL